jgi:hypothetical protein
MPCSLEEVVKFFFKNIVKYWGLPMRIMSDRDARFMIKFWKTLFNLVGKNLLKSSSYHPQTYGKTEQINALMDDYLQHYVLADHMNWLDLLDVTHFNYNFHKSSMTSYSPFDFMNRQQPTSTYFLTQGYYGTNPLVMGFVKSWKDWLET